MKLSAADAKTLGVALRQAREDAGMSRGTLGAQIGRDPSIIQAYEAGGRKAYGQWIVAAPSEKILAAIASSLGVTVPGLLAAAGLGDDAEAAGAAAMAESAVTVRNEMSGVTVMGASEDVSALLGLALERGLLGRLTFEPAKP